MAGSDDDQFVFAAVADQRRQFASLINDLDDAQFATPSLCLGWDVKTVAAHVVSTVLDGMPGFLQMAIRCGSLSRGIDVWRDVAPRRRPPRSSPLSVNTLIARSRHRCSGRGVRWPTSWFTAEMSGFRSACRLSPMCSTRCRRWIFSPAAGRSALSRWDDCAEFGCPPTMYKVWREGAEANGPVGALLMSVCGRTASLDALDGPGSTVLRRRLPT